MAKRKKCMTLSELSGSPTHPNCIQVRPEHMRKFKQIRNQRAREAYRIALKKMQDEERERQAAQNVENGGGDFGLANGQTPDTDNATTTHVASSSANSHL